MKHILRAVSVAAVMACSAAWAQPGRMAGPGMSANMAKFFGGNKAFSASVETTVQSPQSPGPMTMEMKMFMLDGKTRMEMDMTKMKGGGMPPGAAAQMKQMGMDKTVSIVRPDEKMTFSVFPGTQSYFGMPMSDKQVADAMNESKIEKVSIGKETLGGHPCEKNKLIVTGEDGEKHEVTVWNATDMKDFPIQIEMTDHGSTITMKYTDIKLDKPETKLFDPPAGYTKYDSYQQFMQGVMTKRGGP
jgi:hypothetical protein